MDLSLLEEVESKLERMNRQEFGIKEKLLDVFALWCKAKCDQTGDSQKDVGKQQPEREAVS